MAVGLKEAGFELVWANDFDKNAVKAYRHNLGDHIVLGDINEIDPDDIPDADVIAGGPPCQDYSAAGKGEGERGERGKMVWTYLRIIERKQPKAFIFENVKGLISKRHRPTFDALIEKFNEIGYTVSWKLINAWDYGVAQKRERVFIVGIRKDLGFIYEFPAPDPADYRTKVLRDVIGDLPDPRPYYYRHPRNYNRRAVFSIDEPSPAVRTVNRPMPDNYMPHPADAHVQNHEPKELTEKQLAFLKRNPASVTKNRPVTMDEPSRTIPAVIHKGVPYGLIYPPNHQTYPLTQAQYEHSRDHQIGYNASLDKPARTLRAKAENILDVANHNEKSYWMPKSDYTYDQANRKQSMDKPSNTSPAHHNSMQPIHPTQAPRRFTVRECLRIQSAPDWYVLPDDISLSAQYRIVGNGVPCRVAWHLGRALAEQLNAVKNEIYAFVNE